MATTSDPASDLTAGKLYALCMDAKPAGGEWFSMMDTATRLFGAIKAYYRLALTEPIGMTIFVWGWNNLWYGRFLGVLLTMCLPVLPFMIMAVELGKRLNSKLNPYVDTDWKLQGPGRVFFVGPDSLLASIFWDFYLALSVLTASYLQYGTDADGLEHTWYDAITTKDFWLDLLDQAGAKRPRQLGSWDGSVARSEGPGVEYGRADLVCKITDSYLGIGDKVLKRGVDFACLEDLQEILSADPAYKGKPAIMCEFIKPDESVQISSEGFGAVHSLDIVTTRTKNGVKVLTVLLWTDCETWTSHSCTAGYIIDVHTETIVAATAWYSPHFAKQTSSLIGTRIPGIQEACAKAVAAHSACGLPWLTTVGWDAMITNDGVYFFEGNVAAYRTPRRVFLTPELTTEFFNTYRGPGSPVPWRHGATPQLPKMRRKCSGG